MQRELRIGEKRCRGEGTHVDDHVDLAVSLLLEDAVGRPNEEGTILQEVDLLQREIRLEEGALQLATSASVPPEDSRRQTSPKMLRGRPR